ncbi:SOS response-associated peptidase family protein [Curvibacter sp. RS43]|uniref:SOS response-associated peptidase n=1 Tax=Curvibacter microcysteis TaxID=3026419 RepID=UPI0023614452|nr:SOS response-associated peptidase family protein [Curvibacter sp. RS43]MDD0809255.1 SOS response-associated peptidase family protein [Curvibacter sp. RS43]
MCAHFEAVYDPERLRKTFKLTLPEGGRRDVWPSYPAAFIRYPRPLTAPAAAAPAEEVGGGREALLGRFGLIPHWAKDASVARHTYNARSETVASKPSFRDAWRLGRRCIVPAEAIYEPDWRSGKAVPTRIVRADGEPWALAGLWTGWRDASGAVQRSFTLLTVNADQHPFMNQFHQPNEEKRMVVALREADFSTWLQAPLAQAAALVCASPAGDWRADEGEPSPAPA